MIQTILWLIVIAAAAYSQKLIIEKRVPNHLLWFGIRIIAFGLFSWWLYASGYYLAWAMPWMILSFAFLFPLFLNELRGKYLGYMSDRGYDKIMKQIFFGEEGLVFLFLLMFFIIASALHIVYNFIEPTSFLKLWKP